MNGRGTVTLPLKEFADNLNQFTNNDVTVSESNAIGKECDIFRKGVVSHTDIEYLVSKQQQKVQKVVKKICIPRSNTTNQLVIDSQLPPITINSAIQDLIFDHPIFPNWLTARPDFLEYYEELLGENGMPSNHIIETILKTKITERKSSDVSVVCKWIKLHKILSYVRPTRLMDVCKYV